MHVRLNVTLPEDTVKLIDRIARKRGRSRFIDQAIKHYIDEMGRASLRKRVKEGAIARAERDLRLTGEWFALEEEAEGETEGDTPQARRGLSGEFRSHRRCREQEDPPGAGSAK